MVTEVIQAWIVRLLVLLLSAAAIETILTVYGETRLFRDRMMFFPGNPLWMRCLRSHVYWGQVARERQEELDDWYSHTSPIVRREETCICPICGNEHPRGEGTCRSRKYM